jgi:uncharacterized SAM-binding protein YcdF (DUF218 family)
MFLLKKMVGSFFYPLSLCLEIMFIGLIFIWFTKKQRTGKAILSIGLILLIALSYPGLPEYCLKPLETRYPPLLKVDYLKEVRWVAVLGGGLAFDPTRPANAQLSKASLSRLIEGIRLHKALAGTKLILSGGAIYNPVSEAETMAQTALALGVDRGHIIPEATSKDTEDAAQMLKKIIGSAPFILVTSASHMPRSTDLCKKLDMQPIPAPTDYMIVERSAGISPDNCFPSLDRLEMAKRAFHEYMGLAWAKLRSRA